MRRPLSLLSLRDSFPSPARGEGLDTGDLPRLSCFAERDEGELALRGQRFKVAIALARDRHGLQAKRGAALLQEVDIDAELIADGHRAGEFDRVGCDQDRLAG